MKKTYVAYYRVSTKTQGISGLGIEAQKKSGEDFVRGGELIAEYTETESGKKDSRPQLNSALEHAKSSGAVLVIAKLDRLSRNIGFIFALKDSGVNFVACDLPEMNTLNLGIFATIAQHERELISKRTSAALQAKKARGFTLGTPANLTDEARAKGLAVRRRNAAHNENLRRASLVIATLKKEGLTLRLIAERLNAHGFRTRRGCLFGAESVRRLGVGRKKAAAPGCRAAL
jgi:DNA invertase Pin-like site-specific DNA recombinase